MRTTTSASLQGIRHNTRIKRYPDGSAEVLACNLPVFRESGWERPGNWSKQDAALPLTPEEQAEQAEQEYRAFEREAIRDEDGRLAAQRAEASRLRAQRRARTQVRDLALCNSFRWFVTLTLDAQRVNRYDVAAITRKLNAWLDNAVRRHGLKYILVPEKHKDGAVHFHGFFSDALRAADSGTVIPPEGGKPRRPRSAAQREAWLASGGRAVYNLPQWTLGFTTAIELYGEYRAAVGYVCKYINKGSEKVGGRWFYHGGELRRPDVQLCDANIDEIERMEGAATFRTPTLAEARFAALHIDGEGVKEWET